VQETREGTGFRPHIRGDFEHDLPVVEDFLFGEEDAAERSSAELADQSKARELITSDGQGRSDVCEVGCRVGTG